MQLGDVHSLCSDIVFLINQWWAAIYVRGPHLGLKGHVNAKKIDPLAVRCPLQL
jgi:hypothetical protein